MKDLIIIRGRNLYPQDIEACATSGHPAFVAAAAFPIEQAGVEAAVLACEVDRSQRRNLDAEDAMRSVMEAVAGEFDIHLHAVVLLKPGTLARTTSGKIARGACREAYLSHAWKPLATRHAPEAGSATSGTSRAAGLEGRTREERRAWLLAQLRQRTANALGVPESTIDETRPLADIGMDSLLRVEMLLRLEADLGFSIDDEAIGAETTLGGMADRILDLQAAG